MGGAEALFISSIAGSILSVAKASKKPDTSAQQREAEKQQKQKEAKERKRERDKVVESRTIERKEREEEKLGNRTTLSGGAASLTDPPQTRETTLKAKLGE
ncbi:hypothetical protein [Pseudodesulfovibrio sediminis]|uniref:Uncharacterized protein n=1 Tax=Pseudodesulfovibrio sediminis TaxID=2810563 RepID=A0ABN6EVK6_9BACT|nr:hypothetical protein [Pseudodesulfovibrio sediminis]BCS89094.1 hypothetical protein PSDVSF_23360 [Pseudodesulfovibrio sediminis]